MNLKPVFDCNALKEKQQPCLLGHLKIKQSKTLTPRLGSYIQIERGWCGTRGQIVSKLNWAG